MGNNKFEFEEFREQMGLLKNKLNKHEIVSEESIQSVTHGYLCKINRDGIMYTVLGLFAVPFCCWVLYDKGFCLDFTIGTGILLAASLVATVLLHKMICTIDVTKGHLLEVAKTVTRFRMLYNYFIIASFPVLAVWMYYFLRCAKLVYTAPGAYERIFKLAIVAALVGTVIGLYYQLRTVCKARSVLLYISELQAFDDDNSEE